MPMDQFAQHLLPSLLSLSSDPVPNVRVLVAKALRQNVLEKRKRRITANTNAFLGDIVIYFKSRPLTWKHFALVQHHF